MDTVVWSHLRGADRAVSPRLHSRTITPAAHTRPAESSRTQRWITRAILLATLGITAWVVATLFAANAAHADEVTDPAGSTATASPIENAGHLLANAADRTTAVPIAAAKATHQGANKDTIKATDKDRADTVTESVAPAGNDHFDQAIRGSVLDAMVAGPPAMPKPPAAFTAHQPYPLERLVRQLAARSDALMPTDLPAYFAVDGTDIPAAPQPPAAADTPSVKAPHASAVSGQTRMLTAGTKTSYDSGTQLIGARDSQSKPLGTSLLGHDSLPGTGTSGPAGPPAAALPTGTSLPTMTSALTSRATDDRPQTGVAHEPSSSPD